MDRGASELGPRKVVNPHFYILWIDGTLQEVFAKAVSSLRWDLNRKQFITVVECRHPIYRMFNAFVLMLNKRKTRIDHARAWFRSIIEEVRNGKVKSFSEEQANKSKMLKLKNSLLMLMSVGLIFHRRRQT